MSWRELNGRDFDCRYMCHIPVSKALMELWRQLRCSQLATLFNNSRVKTCMLIAERGPLIFWGSNFGIVGYEELNTLSFSFCKVCKGMLLESQLICVGNSKSLLWHT